MALVGVRSGNGDGAQMPRSLIILKVGASPTPGVSGNLTTGATWDGNLSVRKIRIGYMGKRLE